MSNPDDPETPSKIILKKEISQLRDELNRLRARIDTVVPAASPN